MSTPKNTQDPLVKSLSESITKLAKINNWKRPTKSIEEQLKEQQLQQLQQKQNSPLNYYWGEQKSKSNSLYEDSNSSGQTEIKPSRRWSAHERNRQSFGWWDPTRKPTDQPAQQPADASDKLTKYGLGWILDPVIPPWNRDLTKNLLGREIKLNEPTTWLVGGLLEPLIDAGRRARSRISDGLDGVRWDPFSVEQEKQEPGPAPAPAPDTEASSPKWQPWRPHTPTPVRHAPWHSGWHPNTPPEIIRAFETGEPVTADDPTPAQSVPARRTDDSLPRDIPHVPEPIQRPPLPKPKPKVNPTGPETPPERIPGIW